MKQSAMPGIEPPTDAERAQHRAGQPLRGKVAQRPPDFGLFGDDAAQLDLVDVARAAEREP